MYGKGNGKENFFAVVVVVCCRVREASMSGLETLTRFVVESDPSLLKPET